MADLELTGLARIPLHMLNHVEEVGLDRVELMHAAVIDEAELRDPDARIPVSKIWNLWRIVIERVPDPALGVRMGAAARVREFGIVGYTMLFSATLRGAFERLARACEHRLGLSPTSFGLLVDDLHVYRAIAAQRPIGLEHPQAPATRALMDVAHLLHEAIASRCHD